MLIGFKNTFDHSCTIEKREFLLTIVRVNISLGFYFGKHLAIYRELSFSTYTFFCSSIKRSLQNTIEFLQ